VDILIVDPSEATRFVLRRMLASMQVATGEIREAGDAGTALNVLSTTPVGLVLTEMELPDMSGLQLMSRIREKPELKDLPIVFLTRAPSRTTVLEATALGAAGFVSKPFDSNRVLNALAGVQSS
jgi:CheY-like chemotaxis protein